jgi:hypothetical protein
MMDKTRTSGREQLDEAFEGLEREVPDRVAKVIRWLREPKAKWVRIPVGLALIAGGMFGFMPVLGFEFIPLGLLIIAIDIPFLQKPVARLTLWLEHKWVAFKQRRKERKRRREARHRGVQD